MIIISKLNQINNLDIQQNNSEESEKDNNKNVIKINSPFEVHFEAKNNLMGIIILQKEGIK